MNTDNVTMTINTDNSSGKAVASRLGLNRKSKHVQLRFLYIQDAVQRGKLIVKEIRTTHNPANVLTKHLPAAAIQPLHGTPAKTTTTTTATQHDLQLVNRLRQQSLDFGVLPPPLAFNNVKLQDDKEHN
eukprot:3819629-Amphidinium_carterae.8